jgi:hypothetical protein
MKSSRQIVLLVLMIAVLIGGLAFITQFTGFRPAPPRKELPSGPLLRFSQRNATDPDDGEECELGTSYQRDYWIENLTTAPVDLHWRPWVDLDAKAPLALKAGIAWLTPAEVESWTARKEQPNLEAAERWQPLKATVVPAPPRQGPVGVLRLSWEGKEPGKTTVLLPLTTSQAGRGRDEALEHIVVFLPAFLVESTEVKLRDLVKGQQDTAEVICWSATRRSFPLEVRKEKLGPNIDCSLEPLTEQQCRTLAQKKKGRVLSGYRLRITAHERRDGKALDLGPLEGTLVLEGPKGSEPVAVKLTGMVRGAVKVLAEADPDVLPLGSFRAADGKQATFTLASSEADVQLRLMDRKPLEIEARLERMSPTRWQLHITVPPRAVAGLLPADSAVILEEAQGETKRRLRLPLRGQGTQ